MRACRDHSSCLLSLMTPFQGPMAACFRGQIPRSLPLTAGWAEAPEVVRGRAPASSKHQSVCTPRPSVEGSESTWSGRHPRDRFFNRALRVSNSHRWMSSAHGHLAGAPSPSRDGCAEWHAQGTDLGSGPAREGAEVGCIGSFCFFVHTL